MKKRIVLWILFCLLFAWFGKDGQAQNPPVNATQLRGRTISTTAPTNGQVYEWDVPTLTWKPSTPSPGGVTSITAGTGISVNASTGAVTVTNTATTNCPAGAVGNVQYYVSAGVCGGDAAFAWDNTNKLLEISGVPLTPIPGLFVGPSESTLNAIIQGYTSGTGVNTLLTGNQNHPALGLECEGDSSDGQCINAVNFMNGTQDNTATIEADAVSAGSGRIQAIRGFVNPGAGSTSSYAEAVKGEVQVTGGNITTGVALHALVNPNNTGSAVNLIGVAVDDVTTATNNFAIKTGLGLNQLGDVLYLAGNVVNPFQQTKNTQAATAPGAGKADLRWIAGTNAGTCKLVANAGTSATEVTIIDNVGGSC